MNDNKKILIGPNWFLQGLTLIFVAAKLTNHIDWSWWWVFAPLWIPISVILVLAFIVAVVEAFSEFSE